MWMPAGPEVGARGVLGLRSSLCLRRGNKARSRKSAFVSALQGHEGGTDVREKLVNFLGEIHLVKDSTELGSLPTKCPFGVLHPWLM